MADLAMLAASLKASFEAHNVPTELHYSLACDVVFRFACLLDEKTGSNLHERIDGELATHFDSLTREQEPADYLIAELEILFGSGSKIETNLLKSHVDDVDHLLLNLEMALGVRGLDEIGADVDTSSRFAALLKRRKGVKELRFNRAEDLTQPKWRTVPSNGSKLGDFEQSLAGVCSCILETVRPWISQLPADRRADRS